MPTQFKLCSLCSGGCLHASWGLGKQSRANAVHRSIELASSVYGMLGKPNSIVAKCHELVLKYGKFAAVAIPVLVVLLLQVPAIQNVDMVWFLMTHSIRQYALPISTWVYLLKYRITVLGSVVLSIIIVALIFVKYIQYRKKVRAMMGLSSSQKSRVSTLLSRRRSNATSNSANHHGLYDQWLLPRFGVIILFLM